MSLRVKKINWRKVRTVTKFQKVTEKRQSLQREKEYRMKSISMFKWWKSFEKTSKKSWNLWSIVSSRPTKLPKFKKIEIPSSLELNAGSLPKYSHPLLKWIEYLTPVEIVYKYSRVCRAFYLATFNYEFLHNYLINTIGKPKFLEMKYYITISLYPDLEPIDTNEVLGISILNPDDQTQLNKTLQKRSQYDNLFVEDIEDEDQIWAKLEEDNKSTSEEERDLDEEIANIKKQSVHKENEEIMQKIPTDEKFLHRFLIFLASLKICYSCGVMEENIDSKSLLIIWPIIGKPIWFQCKKSEQFRMINVKGALKKYNLKKDEFDEMKLGFISAPSSYYSNKPMKLYYEFQIEDKMKNINKTREINKKEASKKKEFDKMIKRINIYSERLTENLLCLQDYFYGEKEFQVFDKYVLNHYLQTPLMKKYLNKKIVKMSELELMVKLYETEPITNPFASKVTLPKGKFYSKDTNDLGIKDYLERKNGFDIARKKRKRKNYAEDGEESSEMDEDHVDENRVTELVNKSEHRVTRNMNKYEDEDKKIEDNEEKEESESENDSGTNPLSKLSQSQSDKKSESKSDSEENIKTRKIEIKKAIKEKTKTIEPKMMKKYENLDIKVKKERKNKKKVGKLWANKLDKIIQDINKKDDKVHKNKKQKLEEKASDDINKENSVFNRMKKIKEDHVNSDVKDFEKLFEYVEFK